MWARISHLILRHRMPILIGMLLITAVMGWQATHLELSYKYARVLPADDPAGIAYEEFKARYGEDGNVMVVAFQDSNLFRLDRVQGWYDLTESVRKIPGIQDVMSITRCYNLLRNDSLEKFDVVPLISARPTTQADADSLQKKIVSLPFYEGLILNKKTKTTVMVVTFKQSDLNSKNRIDIVQQVKEKAQAFGAKTNIQMRYSGMPYIRTEYMRKISSEMKLFSILSLVVTALILILFFRYFNAVFYSLIVVIVGVIWSLGIMVLFGYKITVLSGLIPPLIVIIGLPNCIFLINKYQEELLKHGNKAKALGRMVQKVGLSNFLANVTTAIGFFVFYFTQSSLLVEFGIVASISVMTTYAIAMILTPIFFSWLPEPKLKHAKHLNNSRINGILDLVDNLVHNHRRKIYISVLAVTVISLIGFFRIHVIGYVVDDLPNGDPVTEDLHFYEKNFHGILPFEVAIEVKQVAPASVLADVKSGKLDKSVLERYASDSLGPKTLFDQEGDVLYKIDSLQRFINRRTEFSKPISIVEALKFSYQAYKDGRPRAYRLPGNRGDLKALADYSSTVSGQQQKLNTFIDSTKTHTRVSFQMADVGSDSAKKIAAQIKPVVDSLFPKSYFKVDMTGNSLMFLKSFDYLLHHLFVSLLIAIILILLIGMVLFRSVAIIVLSKAPCLIPLVMTAGVMGYLGIPFKSSTILIFSIAFGIASDGTIYILTEYRNQLRKLSAANASKAVSNAIRETGLSMIYTNVILFSGFAIFIASSFGGTAALGILLSITLLVSLVTNLVLLPCILLSLEKRMATRALMKEPLIDIYDEEEDIDADKLTIQTDTQRA